MAAAPLIKLENVWKVYQFGKMDLTVLRGVSVDVNPGTFLTIMGPSGSGKSTLLHLMGCLDIPTRGRVILEGRDISQLSEDNLAVIRGRKIGFVFQQFNLMRNLTSVENVMLPMVFQGVPETRRRERAIELLKKLDLGKRILHKPSELSGGEQQRVAIARALANNPDIIVADEPTGNLDSSTGKMIMDILANFHHKENKTVIVVTHDPTIASYSHQIIHIKDGEIIKNHFQEENVLWKG